MAIDRNSTCAVPGCGAPISGPNNLCAEHRLPGIGVRVGGSAMVITAWYAEHEDETGLILLNDLALGEIFGGGAGFKAKPDGWHGRVGGWETARRFSKPEYVGEM